MIYLPTGTHSKANKPYLLLSYMADCLCNLFFSNGLIELKF